MYSQSQFIAELLSELRTPTASILGYSELLLSGEDGVLNQQQETDVLIIQEAGKNLIILFSLIKEVFFLDKKVKDFSLDEKLQKSTSLLDAINDSFSYIKENGRFLYANIASDTDFVIEVPAELPPIYADKFDLIHMIASLIIASAGSVPSCSKIVVNAEYGNKWVDLAITANPKGHRFRFDELKPKYAYIDIYESITQERQAGLPNPVSFAISYGLSHLLHGAELRTRVTENNSVIILRVLANQ